VVLAGVVVLLREGGQTLAPSSFSGEIRSGRSTPVAIFPNLLRSSQLIIVPHLLPIYHSPTPRMCQLLPTSTSSVFKLVLHFGRGAR
jgi:hypothetical protein